MRGQNKRAFAELMNEEKERGQRVEDCVEQEIVKFS